VIVLNMVLFLVLRFKKIGTAYKYINLTITQLQQNSDICTYQEYLYFFLDSGYNQNIMSIML